MAETLTIANDLGMPPRGNAPSWHHQELEHFPEPGEQPVDRLPPMLFLAALIHGILIIGITFNAVLNDQARDAISLEVTILADPDYSVATPDESNYLAQANQVGSGNTRDAARPTAPLQSVIPIDNVGVAEGTKLLESAPQELVADEVLVSRDEQQLKVFNSPREKPQTEIATAIALEAGSEESFALPQDDSTSLLIRNDNPRQLVTSVNTKESKIAAYLNTWKRKIESTGVRYFPEQGVTRGITGSPTLEVTISASGQLDEVIVRKTSGSKVLDQAALNILRRAAPFEPFPEAIRADYDQLRFAYKWQFRKIGTATAASTN